MLVPWQNLDFDVSDQHMNYSYTTLFEVSLLKIPLWDYGSIAYFGASLWTVS